MVARKSTKESIMTKSRKFLTIAIAAAALAVGSLGTTGSANAGGKHWHGHWHGHYKFFPSVIVVGGGDYCGWKYFWFNGYKVKKWMCY
jgi:hypothetical protein